MNVKSTIMSSQMQTIFAPDRYYVSIQIITSGK